LKIISVFENNEKIPAKYTCVGENINPKLEFLDVPENTKSLVLIMDDPDAIKPAGKVWDHWVLFDISPTTKTIEENSVPENAIQGLNSWNKNEYGGPCPPDGEHRYFFKLYALDTTLDLDSSATKKDVEEAMSQHIIEKAELIGRFSK